MMCGPFYGEFGWELMKWQGHLRWLSKSYPIDVRCVKGKEFLYEGFARKVIPVDQPWDTPDKWRPIDRHSGSNIQPSKGICERGDLPQTFIKYGEKKQNVGFDVLLHARTCQRKCDDVTGSRAWEMSNWKTLERELTNQGLRVAFIGSKRGSVSYGEEFDKRGVPLKTLANIMASSKVIVGPSSGPMHYASLCGLPHVVWTDKRKWNVGGIRTTNWNRYKKYWNPHKTPCTVMDTCNWDPSPKRVLSAMEKFL